MNRNATMSTEKTKRQLAFIAENFIAGHGSKQTRDDIGLMLEKIQKIPEISANEMATCFDNRLSRLSFSDGSGFTYNHSQMPSERTDAMAQAVAHILWMHWYLEEAINGSPRPGDYARKMAKETFGLRIARQYFDYGQRGRG